MATKPVVKVVGAEELLRLPQYSNEQLYNAFQLVKNKRHWKLPINAVINPAHEDIVCAAIIHFTGSVPEFSIAPRGKLHVKAAGYYRTMGA